MNVLVDTSVWSLSLRRARPKRDGYARELEELVREGRVVMLGAIRQELLSRVQTEHQFKRLRDVLRAFKDAMLEPTLYESAAHCFNMCRRAGIQGSNTDFLLCAVALAADLSLFTTDKDFDRFSKILGVRLHEIRDELR